MNRDCVAADIMSTSIIIIPVYMELSEFFKMFHKHQVSGFPVVDHEAKLLGVVSQTDILPFLKPYSEQQEFMYVNKKSSAEKENFNEVCAEYQIHLRGKVSDIMTASSFSLNQNASIKQIASMMKKLKIHRVFITASDFRILGVVSTLDLVKVLGQGRGPVLKNKPDGSVRSLETILVDELMHKEIASAHEDLTVKELIELFLEKHVSGMPVVNDQNVVMGVVSKGDIVRGLSGSRETRITLNTRAYDLMSKSILHIRKNFSLAQAASMMHENGVHRLIIKNERNQLEGVLSASDLVHLLA